MNRSELSHMAGAIDDSTINIVVVIIIIIIHTLGVTVSSFYHNVAALFCRDEFDHASDSAV